MASNREMSDLWKMGFYLKKSKLGGLYAKDVPDCAKLVWPGHPLAVTGRDDPRCGGLRQLQQKIQPGNPRRRHPGEPSGRMV